MFLRHQCICLFVTFAFGRYNCIQNLQIGNASHSKDLRWTSLQVSITNNNNNKTNVLFINRKSNTLSVTCREYLEFDLTLSQEKIQNIAGVAVAHVNGFTAELRRLFLVEDLVDSIKFGVILWVMTYIGAWFNGMTLVILGECSRFSSYFKFE